MKRKKIYIGGKAGATNFISQRKQLSAPGPIAGIGGETMRKPRIVQLKGFDGSIIPIEVTKDYPIARWNQQNCWAFFCNNPFYFIHLNRNGKATHAYCYHASGSFNEKGKWVHIEKGKLVVDWESNGKMGK